MLWSQPWDVGWGDPEDFFIPPPGQKMFTAIPGAIKARFIDPNGLAGNVRIVVDGVAQGIKKAFPGEVCELTGQTQFDGTDHLVTLVPQGGWAGPVIDVAPQQEAFVAARSSRFKALISAQLSFLSYRTGGAPSPLSAIALWNLWRNKSCAAVPGRQTWGQLTATLTNVGAVRTLILKCNNTIICKGSRTGDGIVTMYPADGQIAGGYITVAYTADITDLVVIARWPAFYELHWKTSLTIPAWSSGDFPRTPDAIVLDDNAKNSFVFHSPPLASGAYHLLVHQVDENGNRSAGTADVLISAVSVPLAPAAVAPVLGSTPALAITASPTAGAGYNLYDSAATGLLALDTPLASLGSGNHTYSLPAVPGFTGWRQLLVRATLAGVEEGNSQLVQIEYVAGVAIATRPTPPSASVVIATSGRTLTLHCTLDTNDLLANPDVLQIFIWPVTGAPDYTTPNAELAVTGADTIKLLDISATAGSDGLYYCAVRSRTTAGTQSNNTAYHGPAWLGTAAFQDPAALLVLNE